MSAIEQFPIPQVSNDSQERRRAERLRVPDTIAVIFGRGEGVLIDLSRRGARVRHSTPVRRGTSARISFEWERMRFSATAEVLAARVISLGAGPSYESRLRFTAIDPSSENVLAAALEGIARQNVRRWVANMQGWNEDAPSPAAKPAGSFIRCRLHGRWWERKCTSDTQQPADGFLLPADSNETEITTLCDHYARAGEEERQLIRTMAAVAVEQAVGVH